jgi:hypothetical protein
MAVNHADGTLIFSVVLYPVAAAIGAVHGGAGAWTILFVPAGLAVGIGILYVGRRAVYSITGFGFKQSATISRSWIRGIFSVPFFLLYMILPAAIACAGIVGVGAGSEWLAGRLF